MSALPAVKIPMPALHDQEGAAVNTALPPVIDAHIHLFPEPFWEHIWQWFDRYAWPVRYRLNSEEVIEFLLSRGVSHLVGMHYPHKPGLAEMLNRYMADLCRRFSALTGLATVFPGEPGDQSILEEAFKLGLSGVKLHLHVQGVAPDSKEMATVYRVCAEWDKPLLMHAGREPASPAYPRDPHSFCSVERIEQVLKSYPSLKLIVPHLGADEYEGYQCLLEKYDNLWLDTTMMLAEYFPLAVPWAMLEFRPERILYGTDFPNIPYAWDRELRLLLQRRLPEDTLSLIAGGTARKLFGIGGEVLIG